MKQSITWEQINELTPSQKDELANWGAIMSPSYWPPFPYLTIGQMLELLENAYELGYNAEKATQSITGRKGEMISVWWIVSGDIDNEDHSTYLCDALWTAVKEVLSGTSGAKDKWEKKE